jgi:hypothetical protein
MISININRPHTNKMPHSNKNPISDVPVSDVSVIIVERNGDLRLSQMKEYSPMELCKKCKYKSPAGFEMRAEWAYSGPDEDKFTVELWAREDGKSGQENKYEFPPPVDTMLFFGGCALVAKDMTAQHCVIPLTLQKWEKMYNFLFGGFDTLPNCDDPESDESDELTDTCRKTKDGYLKDGFVIDNNEGFETDYEEDVSTLTDDVSDDSDDSNSDDSNSDDSNNDDSDSDDDDDSDDDNDDDSDDDNDKLKQKCNHAKIKMTPVTKKRNTRHQLKEEVGPSFELVEETYEYSDD